MNKKFFTLIAGTLLLAASLGTAKAQYATGEKTSKISLELPAINQVSERFYQLGVTTGTTPSVPASHLLAVEKTANGQYYLRAVNGSGGYDLPSTLWRIVTRKNNEGALSYAFENVKFANLPLTYVATLGANRSASLVTPATIATSYLSGEINLWKWQLAVKLDDPTARFGATALTAAFGTNLDSLVTLAATDAVDATHFPTIGLVKYSLGDVPNSIPNQIRLTPYDAAPVLLTPADLNSMLWTQELTANSRVSFTFTPEAKSTSIPKNLFTNGSFRAVDAVGYPADYSAFPTVSQTAFTPYGGYAYNADAVAYEDAKFEKEYLDAKLALAQEIGNIILAEQANIVSPSTLTSLSNDISAALGYTASNPTGAIGKIVKAPKRGDRNTTGSAANIVYTDPDVLAYLNTATDFEKKVVDAVIKYFEDAPARHADPLYAITHSGTDVIQPIITKLTTLTLGSLVPANITAAVNDIVGVPFLAASGTETWSTALGTATTYLATAKDEREKAEKQAKDTDRKENRWISLIVEGEEGKADTEYLSVGTDYVTTDQDLAFTVQKFVDAGDHYPWLVLDDPARLDLNGRFNFQFRYFPTQDSLEIRVGGFAIKQKNQTWGELNTTDNPDLGLNRAGVQSDDPAVITAASKTPAGIDLDRNLVKLALLTDGHSEVTVGSSKYDAGQDPRTTINTLIRIGRNALTDNRATLPTGLYFIKLKTNDAKRKQLDGAYKYRHIADVVGLTWAHEDASQLADGKIQNFGYLPAAQWVVEQYTYGDTKTNLVSIYNREYPDIKIDNVQLYKAGNGSFELKYSPNSYFSTADTLTITEISKTEFPDAYNVETLGYYKEKEAKYYKLDYLSGLKTGNFLKVLDSQTDSLIYVSIKEDDNVFFELEEVTANPTGNYGYPATKAHDFKQLKRTAYNIRVKAPHLLFADGKYIVRLNKDGSSTGEPQYAISSVPQAQAVNFFLKENNRIGSIAYFALEEATYESEYEYFSYPGGWSYSYILHTGTKLWYEGFGRVSVKDGSLYLIQSGPYEERVSAFALDDEDIYLYRRFDKGIYGSLTEDYGDEDDSPLWLKFTKFNNKGYEFLSENTYNEGKNPYHNGLVGKDTEINFLGLYNIKQYEEVKDTLSYTFFVDTAYVRGETVMPQYMLALNPDIQPEARWTYKGDGQWYDENGDPVPGSFRDDDDEVYFPRVVKGDYLFNAQDSVDAGNKAYEGKFAYGAEGLTRLAFVTGAHLRDTFYVLPDKYKDYSAQELSRDTLGLFALDSALYKHPLGKNTHYLSTTKEKDGTYTVNTRKSMVFQFRLIDDSNRRFLIETTRADGETEIAPGTGRWVKIQNGVPVISEEVPIALAAQNGAEIFDVTEGVKEGATANEAVAATAVKVISEAGAVTILNAAGKSVSISNILGQTVAATVLTSDNARVALPKGIVIVAVEGEAAIKAVVK